MLNVFLPSPPRTYNVECCKFAQVNGQSAFDQRIAKSEQFVHSDVAHTVDGKQRGHLCVIIHFIGNAQQQIVGFGTRQSVMLVQPFKYSFHVISG